MGSYCGFAQQDALQEKLIGFLTADQARTNSQAPQLRHWFDSMEVVFGDYDLFKLKPGFSSAPFFAPEDPGCENVTPCR